jgi:hypothetical protein
MFMMKRLTVIIAFVLCVGSVMAQYEKKAWLFRPYAGFLLSTMESKGFKDGYDPTWKLNMTFGGQFEWQAMSSSSLLLDVNYRRQGCSFDYKEVNKWEWHDYVVEVNKMTIDYLNFGVQWKMYFIPNLSARIGIELMAPISSLTAHGHTYGKIAYNPEDPGRYSPDDDVSKYVWDEFDEYQTEKIKTVLEDAAFCIPLGFSYECKNFTIGLTYRLDMNRVVDTIDDMFPDEPNYSLFSYSKSYPIYFHAFDLTVGYNIPMKKRK